MDEQPLDICSMTEEELDAELRRFGYDPNKIGKGAASKLVERIYEGEAWRKRALDAESKLMHALAKLKELGFEPTTQPLWGKEFDRQEGIEQARRALQDKEDA